MIIDKTIKNDEDKELAGSILRKLRTNHRMFGTPAKGLHLQLEELERNAPKEDNYSEVDYNLKDPQWLSKRSKLQAGIKGEKELADYLEKIIRLDQELSDIIVFSSLGEKDKYTNIWHDTDFLLVYGNHLMGLDAKKWSLSIYSPVWTSKDVPGVYQIWNCDLMNSEKNKPKESVCTANNYWEQYGESYTTSVCLVDRTPLEIIGLPKELIDLASYYEYNKSLAELDKNNYLPPCGDIILDWAGIHLIQPSSLVPLLHAWIKDKEPVISLDNITQISKKLIRGKKSNLDLTMAKKMLKV